MNNLTPHLTATMQRLTKAYNQTTPSAQIQCIICNKHFIGMQDNEDTCPDCISDLLKNIPF